MSISSAKSQGGRFLRNVRKFAHTVWRHTPRIRQHFLTDLHAASVGKAVTHTHTHTQPKFTLIHSKDVPVRPTYRQKQTVLRISVSITKSGCIETCRVVQETDRNMSSPSQAHICTLFAHKTCYLQNEVCEQQGGGEHGRLNVHSCKQNLIGAPQPGGQHKAARLYLVIVSGTYTLTLWRHVTWTVSSSVMMSRPWPSFENQVLTVLGRP